MSEKPKELSKAEIGWSKLTILGTLTSNVGATICCTHLLIPLWYSLQISFTHLDSNIHLMLIPLRAGPLPALAHLFAMQATSPAWFGKAFKGNIGMQISQARHYQ
eukprot:764457-Pelagomonas_calceolata.AAC.1